MTWLNWQLNELFFTLFEGKKPTIEHLMNNRICYCCKFQRGKAVALKSHSKYRRMSQSIWLKNPTDDWNCMSLRIAKSKSHPMINWYYFVLAIAINCPNRMKIWMKFRAPTIFEANYVNWIARNKSLATCKQRLNHVDWVNDKVSFTKPVLLSNGNLQNCSKCAMIHKLHRHCTRTIKSTAKRFDVSDYACIYFWILHMKIWIVSVHLLYEFHSLSLHR